MPTTDEQEPIGIDAPARAPWQTPRAVIVEFEETQGVSHSGGDIYASANS